MAVSDCLNFSGFNQLMVMTAWIHVDILHDAGLLACIRARAMGQGMMPDDEVAGIGRDRDDAEGLKVLSLGIDSFGQRFQPIL